MELFFYIFRVLFSRKVEYSQIRKSLLTSESFVFPEKDKHNVWLGLSVARRSILEVMFGTYNRFQSNIPDGVGVIVSQEKEISSKMEYVERYSTEKIRFVISKDKAIIPFSRVYGVFFAFFIILSHIALSPLMLFTNHDKRNLASLPVSLLRLVVIASQIEKNNCRKVYLFYIWQGDTNLIERWLHHNGVDVIYVPLENPISLYSTNLLGRNFVSVIPYQNEEVFYYYSALIDKRNCWQIESRERISDVEKTVDNPIIKKIAIYSHGSFVRKMFGHPLPDIGDIECEFEFFTALKPLIEKTEWRFVIHLHPKEKSDDTTLKWSIQNYRSMLGGSIEFADFNKSTYDQMHEYVLAIGSISSVLFERQAVGYKTLIYASGIKGFPLKGSLINDLVVTRSIDIENKLNRIIQMSQTDYNQKYSEYIFHG